MIDVRGIANGAVQIVNRNVWVTLKQASGQYTTDAAGHRTPGFVTADYKAQVQALSGSDLRHVDGLNIQGVMRSVHLYGNVQGVVRADKLGGDLLMFPEVPCGPVRNWRVVQVMETWPTWCRVIALLQNP